MGRKIRRVPKGWEHPKDARGHEIPMYDKDFASAVVEWEAKEKQFLAGDLETYSGCETYADYAGPKPTDKTMYRPAWTPEEAICYQVYETVSEGTPTSPVFETLTELEEWLVQQGYSREAAHNFCEDGWAPSFVVAGGRMYDGIESAALPRNK